MGKESIVKFAINDQIVLSQTLEGPLAPYINSFAASVGQQGYVRTSVHRKVMLAACFSRWLKDRGIGLKEITSVHPTQYLHSRARRLQRHKGDAAALRHVMEFLHNIGAVPVERKIVCRDAHVARCLHAYEQHLRKVRGLCDATIVNYLPFIRQFLTDRFGTGPVALERLSAEDIMKYVQRQARCLHKRRAKTLTTALRSFLRYVRYCGKSRLDLEAAVPVVPNWSMTSIPRAISTSEVRQLLASIDRRTATGLRDYAILLLLARLGLRSGEVASLTLDDIDWEAGLLRVCGKRGARNELPLPAEVGKAIATYLQQGRPTSDDRHVFLRVIAPVRGFLATGGVGSIVHHRIKRAGIATPTRGAHQFRHGLATEMLRKGASLSEIGDVLGHRHPQTTTIYTKVDLKALRTLVISWPGGVR
jgi:site-specific recombinase XerD